MRPGDVLLGVCDNAHAGFAVDVVDVHNVVVRVLVVAITVGVGYARTAHRVPLAICVLCLNIERGLRRRGKGECVDSFFWHGVEDVSAICKLVCEVFIDDIVCIIPNFQAVSYAVNIIRAGDDCSALHLFIVTAVGAQIVFYWQEVIGCVAIDEGGARVESHLFTAT